MEKLGKEIILLPMMPSSTADGLKKENPLKASYTRPLLIAA